MTNDMHNTFSSKTRTGNENFQDERGCGRGFKGRGRVRLTNGSGNMPTC